MTLPIDSSAATHVGRRDNNEDNFLHEPGLRLFAVADGMGGHEGGEVASAIAVQRLREAVCKARTDASAEDVLGSAMEQTHAAVCAARRGRLKHMGSTLSALLLRAGHAAIGHVGDSRIYRLRRGVLELLTRDHSLAEELRRQGVVLGEEHMLSHVITRALGTDSGCADLQRVSLSAGDVLLLCSDGLHAALGEALIARVLAERPAELAARELVELAYTAGSSDNITAVVVRI
jgi:PPM family protein phosphatase